MPLNDSTQFVTPEGVIFIFHGVGQNLSPNFC